MESLFASAPRASQPKPAIGGTEITGRDISNGRFIKGRKGTTRTKDAARAARSLSLAIRQRLDPDLFVDFQLAIAAGKSPILVELEDGEIVVTIDERGSILPTLEQRTQAMIRLEQRGYGMPMQSVQVEAAIQMHNAHGGAVTPSMADMALVTRLANAFQSAAALPPASVIDVANADSTSAELACEDSDKPTNTAR
jgi:hypothetical protein